MANQSVDILPAFNSKLNLRDAYTFSRDEVYAFLDNVVERPAEYGVKNDISIVKTLTHLNTHLRELSLPDGSYYNGDPKLRPDQHIWRGLDPDWNKGSTSKFIVRHYHVEVEDLSHEGLSFSYWSPYDMLGAFLSMIGSAPLGADKNRFFLPLTAVYGKWCSKIAGNKVKDERKGVGKPPSVFQCTWRTRINTDTVFFLGASLAGFDWRNHEQYGDWQKTIQTARFKLLWNWKPLQNDTDGYGEYERHWSINYSPMIDFSGRENATKFGNCAETYPFLSVFLGTKFEDEEKCFGLALRNSYLVEADSYDDSRKGHVWKNLVAPCMNCARVITLKRGDFHPNFDPILDADQAPE